MAEAKLKVTAEGVNEAAAALGRMGDKMQGVAVQAKGVGTAFTAMKGLIAGISVYAAGRFIWDSVKMADSSAKAIRGFQGLGGTKKILNDAREAIGGVADESDLAAAATQAMRANSGLAAKDFVTLAKFAKFAADQTGGEFAGSLQAVNHAMVSGRPAMLRRLGLTVDMEKAEKAWAHTQGRSASSLSAQEKAVIHSNAALAEMKRKTEGMGLGRGPGDAGARAGAAWKSAREALGAVASPGAEFAANAVAGMLGDKGARKRLGATMVAAEGTLQDALVEFFTEREHGPRGRTAYNAARLGGLMGAPIFTPEIRTRSAGG